MSGFSGAAAIVGIGATEFSKNSGRSEMQLTVEAVTAALADAGIKPEEVDGMSTFTMDNNFETEVFRNIGGIDLKFFSRIHYGGGAACGPLQQAAMAVATGVADVVVCYRGMNERSEYRFGQPMALESTTSESVLFSYTLAQGLQTPAAHLGIAMRRYMHETGATRDDFANIALTDRFHASTNPKAFYYQKPLTLEEYRASKMIADPFCLFDCCQESDGAVAVVVTSAARARDLKNKPALIKGAAQGAVRGTIMMANYHDSDDITPRSGVAFVARQLYAQAGLGPKDMDAAIIYDHFGPTVMPALEGLGFCAKGEAKDFIKDGNIRVGGTLPVNTNGGQLGEAYIHGMNGVAEAVRQIRGTAVNQVKDAANVVITGGTGVPTTGLLLGAA